MIVEEMSIHCVMISGPKAFQSITDFKTIVVDSCTDGWTSRGGIIDLNYDVCLIVMFNTSQRRQKIRWKI